MEKWVRALCCQLGKISDEARKQKKMLEIVNSKFQSLPKHITKYGRSYEEANDEVRPRF